MAQKDFKKLVAYSSISHMGYVILGIAVWSVDNGSAYWSWGMNGAMYQMIAHGVSSAGMFFCVGVIYDRAHHRNLDNFRGLYEPMPLYGGIEGHHFLRGLGDCRGCAALSASSWWCCPRRGTSTRPSRFCRRLTVVITAAYVLWTLQRVYLGTNEAYKDYPDISFRELLCIVPLLVLAVALGVFPKPLVLDWVEPHVTGLIDSLVMVMK